jgi:hypothetical protein
MEGKKKIDLLKISFTDGTKVINLIDNPLVEPLAIGDITRVFFIYNDTQKVTYYAPDAAISLCTVTAENQIIQATIDTVKKDGEELGKNIGSIYTFEIVKYIKTIEFGGEFINFNEVPIKDRVKIVDNLPISINQQIIDFIQNIKKIENEWLTVDIDGEPKTLDIDVSFFDS